MIIFTNFIFIRSKYRRHKTQTKNKYTWRTPFCFHSFSLASNPISAIHLDLGPARPEGCIPPFLAGAALPVAMNHSLPERDASRVPYRRRHYSCSHNTRRFAHCSPGDDGQFYCVCICSLLFGGPRIVVCRTLERTAGAGMELTILSKKGHEVLLLLSCLRHSVTSSAYSDRVS